MELKVKLSIDIHKTNITIHQKTAACLLTVENQKCMKDRGHCDVGLIHVPSADEWGHHTVNMALSLDRGGP